MPEPSAETLDRLTELAPPAFYGVMGVALLAAITGSTGVGFFLLLVGSAIHVARVGLEGR
jgi:hypothetical protein